MLISLVYRPYSFLFVQKIRTIADPESPDDSLYFVFIEINIDDIRELQKITKLEISGRIDADILQAFTQAGTVFCSGKGCVGYFWH